MNNENLDDLFKKNREVKNSYSKMTAKGSSHKCLVEGCTCSAIKSHTISKSALQNIAESGHLISDNFEISKVEKTVEDCLQSNCHNFSFKKVGINDAGIFRGFCAEHDKTLFESLDDSGIRTFKDVLLQVYRTVCYTYFKNYYVAIAEEKNLGYQYNANTDFEEMQELSLKKLKDFLSKYLQDHTELGTTKVKEQICEPQIYELCEINCALIYRRLPTYFDFALEYDIQVKSNDKYNHCIVSFFPQKEYTNLIIACHEDLKEHICSQLIKEIDVLNFLESVFICDSKFFIKTSEYDSWSEQKKKIISDDYYYCNERKFLEPYDVSIFDKIRKKICNDDSYKNELQKIGHIPNRPSFKERYSNQSFDFMAFSIEKSEISGNPSGKNFPHKFIKYNG